MSAAAPLALSREDVLTRQLALSRDELAAAGIAITQLHNEKAAALSRIETLTSENARMALRLRSLETALHTARRRMEKEVATQAS